MMGKLPSLQHEFKREVAKASTALKLPSWQHRHMTNDIYKAAGARLRALRLAKGWNQDQLAQESGVGDKTLISKIENGTIRLNDVKIQRFAEALDCNPGDILNNVDLSVPNTENTDEELFSEAFQVMSDLEKDEIRSFLRMRLAMSRARSSDDSNNNS